MGIEPAATSPVGDSVKDTRPPSIWPRVVVSLSGGMDSTVLLYHLLDLRYTVHAVTVNYGQRHDKEIVAAQGICALLGVEHDVVDLRGLRKILTGSSLTDDVPVPEGHYEDESMKATVVPNRNMLLLSVALARCVSLGYDDVAYAAHAGDHAIYPDCRPEFATAMGSAAALCDYKVHHLVRPFMSWTKADIVKRGDALRVPFSVTWSCYNGRKVHCGVCGTCVERREAFELAGVSDPTPYETR